MKIMGDKTERRRLLDELDDTRSAHRRALHVFTAKDVKEDCVDPILVDDEDGSVDIRRPSSY